MNDRFSMNGDGKKRPPSDRISVNVDGQQPAQPAKPENRREAEIILALRGRYDAIEALWNEAEEDLKSFRIPHDVLYPYRTEISEDERNPAYIYYLGFVRYGKGWRICHGSRDDYPLTPDDHDFGWKPIIECTLDVRVETFDHFAGLRKKVIESAVNAIPRLDEKIARFRKVLKG